MSPPNLTPPAGRPTFPGVMGHRAACVRLRRALARGQLHHALLIEGPTGVGKATLALALGRALHCPEAPGIGCGTCPTCLRVTAGHHPGVERLAPEDGSRNVGVAAARAARLRAERAPLEGPAHLLIIDPAESLTAEAANTLLKTLEEPPPAVYFALVTHNLRALLPTILSRCMLIRLNKLSKSQLRKIISARMPDLSDERMDTILSLANGSAGLAMELANDPLLPPLLALLNASLAAAAAGPTAIFAGDDAPVWAALAKACEGPATGRPARERAVITRLIDLWLLHLRLGVLGKPGPTGVRAKGSPAALCHQLDILLAVRNDLERNAQTRLSFERLLLYMGGDHPCVEH